MSKRRRIIIQISIGRQGYAEQASVILDVPPNWRLKIQDEQQQNEPEDRAGIVQ